MQVLFFSTTQDCTNSMCSLHRNTFSSPSVQSSDGQQPTHTQIKRLPHDHSTDDTPELNELGNLTKRDGTTFSVIEEIGRDYIKFGTQLLEDKRGTTMDSITDDFRGASNIKREVFKRWLRGTGMKPKTWKTLVNLLDSDALKLGTLASDIRDALQ